MKVFRRSAERFILVYECSMLAAVVNVESGAVHFFKIPLPGSFITVGKEGVVFSLQIGQVGLIGLIWYFIGREEFGIFLRVMQGIHIHDRKTFSGEILGENEKAENVKVVLSDNGLVQLYIDNRMIKEGYIDPRRYVSEKMDDNGEVVKQFKRIEFMELLDEIETHI